MSGERLPIVQITMRGDLLSKVKIDGLEIQGIQEIKVEQSVFGDRMPRVELLLIADVVEIETRAEIETINRRVFMAGAMAAVGVFADLEPTIEDVEAAGLFEKYIRDTYGEGKIDTAI